MTHKRSSGSLDLHCETSGETYENQQNVFFFLASFRGRFFFLASFGGPLCQGVHSGVQRACKGVSGIYQSGRLGAGGTMEKAGLPIPLAQGILDLEKQLHCRQQGGVLSSSVGRPCKIGWPLAKCRCAARSERKKPDVRCAKMASRCAD